MWCDLGFVPNGRGNKAAANLHPHRPYSTQPITVNEPVRARGLGPAQTALKPGRLEKNLPAAPTKLFASRVNLNNFRQVSIQKILFAKHVLAKQCRRGEKLLAAHCLDWTWT